MLTPTGPILGTVESAQYDQIKVNLGPGDALAIFTDGLIEVGASRRDMLGIEGVISLWNEEVSVGAVQDAGEMAKSRAIQLITGVNTAAQGGVMRDDVCLLVGVVE